MNSSFVKLLTFANVVFTVTSCICLLTPPPLTWLTSTSNHYQTMLLVWGYQLICVAHQTQAYSSTSLTYCAVIELALIAYQPSINGFL